MDLECRDIFYQYLAGCLLNLIMHLFFQILKLLLLVLCMGDPETPIINIVYTVTLNYVLFCFHLHTH